MKGHTAALIGRASYIPTSEVRTGACPPYPREAAKPASPSRYHARCVYCGSPSAHAEPRGPMHHADRNRCRTNTARIWR